MGLIAAVTDNIMRQCQLTAGCGLSPQHDRQTKTARLKPTQTQTAAEPGGQSRGFRPA